MLGEATARCSGKQAFLKSSWYPWRLSAKLVGVKRAALFFQSAVSLPQGQLWAADERLASLINKPTLNNDCVIDIFLKGDASFSFATITSVISASVKYLLAIKRFDITLMSGITLMPSRPSFIWIINLILFSIAFFISKFIFCQIYLFIITGYCHVLMSDLVKFTLIQNKKSQTKKTWSDVSLSSLSNLIRRSQGVS